jgi:hypothetical protein
MSRRTVLGRPAPTGGRRLRRAAGWAVPLVAALAALVIALQVMRLVRVAPFNDFEGYYAAALAVRQGHSPYYRALAWRDAAYTHHLPGAQVPYGGSPYQYPPAFALAFVPLTFLPLRVVSLLWLGLSLICLAGAAAVLCWLLLPARALARLAGILMLTAMLLVFQPIRVGLYGGQVDALLLLFLVLTLADSSRGRLRRAALWLALAATIKPFLGFLALFLLWKRAYHATFLCGGIAMALFILPIIALGTHPYIDLFIMIEYFSRNETLVSPQFISVKPILLRLFMKNPFTVPVSDTPTIATIGHYFVSLIAIITAIIFVRRHPRHVTRTCTRVLAADSSYACRITSC